MKKLKYGAFALIIVCACLFMSACDFFNTEPKVEEFIVEYTRNLEFFVGEDYHDSLLKGTAIYTDDSEKDVTDSMKVDTSKYDKTKIGTYEIKCEYEGISVGYDVKVVDKITNAVNINNRMVDVVNKTFQRTDNVLSFEASNSSDYQGFDFSEKMIYVDNNGDISAYISWSLDEMKYMEFCFNGTKDDGTMSLINSLNGSIWEEPNMSLDEFSINVLIFANDEIPASLNPSEVLALQEGGFAGELTCSDNIFTLTYQGDSLQYKNNKIISINSASLTFPKNSATNIPEYETIQEIMAPVVENSYTRTSGQLQIEASGFAELANGVIIEHDFVIQEDNGQYLIYNKFFSVGNGVTSFECWFEGTLESGKITYKTIVPSGDDIVECVTDKSIDEFMEDLYSFQLGLNEFGIDYEIALFPSNMIFLEMFEFGGELTVYNDVWTLTQEMGEGVEFALSFTNNRIFEVNGYDVVFGDTISAFAIPSVPSVA